MADNNNRAFLLEISNGKAVPPLPADLARTFEDKPDDQALFEFVNDVVTVSAFINSSPAFVANAIANGLLDLGFKR